MILSLSHGAFPFPSFLFKYSVSFRSQEVHTELRCARGSVRRTGIQEAHSPPYDDPT